MQRLVEDVLHLEAGADLNARELSADEATQLVGLVGEGDAEGLVHLLHVINDLAKTAINRGHFATAGLKPLVGLLHHPSHDVVIQTLKVLAALSFDNQIKLALLDQSIVPVALDLTKSQNSQIVLNSIELIGHISFSSERVAHTFLSSGALGAILSLAAQTGNVALRYSSIRAIGSLSEKTSNQNQIVQEGGLDFLLGVLGNPESLRDETLLYEVIRSLSQLVQQNPPHIKAIVLRRGLRFLMNVVDKFYRASSVRRASKEESSDSDSRSPDLVASDLLILVADDENLRLPFLDNGLITEVVRLLELPVGHAKVVRNLLKLFARLTVNDACMKAIFQYATIILKFIINNDDSEIPITAVLVLGNLSRSDENVTKLIDLGIVDTLLSYIKSNTTANVPLVHVCVNCLRNFAISAANKKRLGEGQVIQTLIYLLPHENPLVQFATVVSLKNLLLGCEPNVDIFIRENGLPPLIAVANGRGVVSEADGQTEEEKLQNADRRIQYECARILVKLVEKESTRKLIVALKGVKPILELVGSEHEVLRIEGSRGVMHLSEVDENRPIIVQESGGAEGLVRVLSHHEDLVQVLQANEEFQLNVGHIFNNLAKNEQSRTALLAANAVPLLKTISKSSSAKARPLFVETLSILTC